MKPNHKIEPSMLDNAHLFDNNFFRRFVLRHAPQPLKLTDNIAKNYLFPTFYGDVTCAQAIFLCSYEKAAKMMLHPQIKPVRMPRGRALLAFSCYIYNQVMGVGPYNEIAMTIPVMVDPGINLPVVPMIADIFKNFGYYVFSMPVTSLENQLRGVKIWGLPKVVHEIDIYRDGDDCMTVGIDEKGYQYMQLRVPTGGRPIEFDVTSNLYTQMGDRLCQSETNFKATFNVIKHMNLLWQKGKKPDREYLTIGKGPLADTLREMEIEEHPFQFRYAEHMSSCFDLPNESYRAPFDPAANQAGK